MIKSAGAAILIFDGDCGFCTTTANYIDRKFQGKLTVEPWQFSDLAKFGLTKEQASAKVQLNVNGKNYAGHAAFAKLLRLHPNPLVKLVGVILVIPPINLVSRSGYLLIAKYRQKLPGGTPACELKRPR